ncbi:Uncharacterised protein [Mycobacteroides abscessus subsp. abscessus]|nr:Uncharacterised protein [Mycobacteroides abscessus subsp. abscessus]
MTPGQIALTPIPCRRSSTRSDCDAMSTAALAVPYAAIILCGRNAAPEEMLTICPRTPASIICCAKIREP